MKGEEINIGTKGLVERDKVIDTIKYLLIVLVVIGHFIEPTKYTSSVTCTIYCMIYSFHMPLFVLISGYLFKQRTLSEEMKKCIPFLEVCLLSHLGFLLIRNGLNISAKNVIYFNDPAWFLLCLAYWRMGTNILLRRFTATHILAIAILLDLLSFCVIKYGGYFSLARAISFYPFFMLGYCLKDKLRIIIEHKNMFLIFGCISIAFVILTSSVLQFKTEFQIMNAFDLKQFTDMSIVAIFAYRYILLLCALSIGGLIYVIIHSHMVLQKYSKYGRTTLFIYFIQSLAFAIVGRYDIVLWESLVIAFMSIPIFTYLSRQRFAPYLMHPVSCIAGLS